MGCVNIAALLWLSPIVHMHVIHEIQNLSQIFRFCDRGNRRLERVILHGWGIFCCCRNHLADSVLYATVSQEEEMIDLVRFCHAISTVGS